MPLPTMEIDEVEARIAEAIEALDSTPWRGQGEGDDLVWHLAERPYAADGPSSRAHLEFTVTAIDSENSENDTAEPGGTARVRLRVEILWTYRLRPDAQVVVLPPGTPGPGDQRLASRSARQIAQAVNSCREFDSGLVVPWSAVVADDGSLLLCRQTWDVWIEWGV